MTVEAERIFISYTRENSDFAWKLNRDLRESNVATWFDQIDIPAGQPWDVVVEDTLKACAGMVVVLTPDSVGSREVRNEVNFVYEAEKMIVPIRLRECDIPYRWSTLNWIEFGDGYDGAFGQLVEALGGERNVAEQAVIRERTPDAGPAETVDEGSWGSERERDLADALMRLRSSRGFVVASVGNYYVQFASIDDDELVMEVVGERFLKSEKRSTGRTATLEGLGFVSERNQNYHQSVSIRSPADAMRIAQLGRQALTTAYGVAWDTPFDIDEGS